MRFKLFSRNKERNSDSELFREFATNFKPIGIEQNIQLLGLDQKVDQEKTNPFMLPA